MILKDLNNLRSFHTYFHLLVTRNVKSSYCLDHLGWSYYMQCIVKKMQRQLFQKEIKAHIDNDTIDPDIFNDISQENNDSTCGLMVLINLAQPMWKAVSCYEPLLPDIFCGIEERNSLKMKVLEPLNDTSCCRSCIIKYNTCYQFLWYTARRQYKKIKINTIDIRIFQFLFDAVEVIFPPIFSHNFRQLLTYKRYENIYVYEHYQITGINAKGLIVKSEDLVDMLENKYIYKCQQGSYISYQHMCDGNNDCPGHKIQDELNCTCKFSEQYTSKCKYLIKNSNEVICSKFYFQDRNRGCYLYQSNILAQYDIFPGEFKQKTQHKQLSCSERELKFYAISAVCTYTLDSDANLVPCTAGEHLQNCKEFECNMMYKCPGYYCVPWSYVCDGKWDCPGGIDESDKHCQVERTCRNMFKCRKQDICIHLGDICDKKHDCVHGDDEHFCHLQGAICPLHCDCLTFVIRCFNTSLNVYPSEVLPYAILYIEKSQLLQETLTSFSYAVYLTLHVTDIKEICTATSKMADLILVDATYNLVIDIRGECFSNAKLLQIIKLSNNQIYAIGRGAFSGLKLLKILNIANNHLSELSNSLFEDFVNLLLLVLSNNSFLDLLVESFTEINVQYLVADDYQFCCIVTKVSYCLSKPSLKYCNILPNNIITIIYHCTAFTICFLSISSIALQQKLRKKREVFGNIAIAINFSDLNLAVYLITLCIANRFYRKRFVLQSLQWRSEALCLILFGLFLNYSMLSPIMLCFMSLSRLMVVINPIDTRFKHTKNLLHSISAIWGFSTCCTTILTITTRITIESIPTVLCSPFFDPSGSVFLIKMIIFMTGTLEIISIIFILFVYTKLIIELKKPQENFKLSNTKCKTNRSLFIHIMVLSTSNVLCWVPSSIIYYYCMIMEIFPVELMFWVTISIIPINSIINPIVFIITELRKIISR